MNQREKHAVVRMIDKNVDQYDQPGRAEFMWLTINIPTFKLMRNRGIECDVSARKDKFKLLYANQSEQHKIQTFINEVAVPLGYFFTIKITNKETVVYYKIDESDTLTRMGGDDIDVLNI